MTVLTTDFSECDGGSVHNAPCRLVQELGEGSWSSIAAQFTGGIGKQCRERWNNQLRPDIRRDAWTQAEEELLVEAHRKLGNRYVLRSSSAFMQAVLATHVGRTFWSVAENSYAHGANQQQIA